MRILLSSSFLRHCDETKILLYRIPSICLIGADAGQKERDKVAALKFLKKAIKRFGNPEAITTDGLRSYTAAMTELGNADKQQIGRWANNRVENSHLPFRRREREMLRFRQMKTLQKFASVHANVHNHFNSERHLVDRSTFKQRRSVAFAEWQSLFS